MKNKYIIIIILVIFAIFYNTNEIKENYLEHSKEDKQILKKINKRIITQEDLIKADEYALKKLCSLKNYGFNKKFNSCVHKSEKTCIEDHPGTVANPEDIVKLEKIKKTGCTPQISAFDKSILRVGVGEWYNPTKEDKEFLIKQRKKVEDLKKIWEKNGKKSESNDYLNYIKADGVLQKAERNAKPSCRYSDQLFKDYCKKQNLKYEPDKSGIGRCIITREYCKSKLMIYDAKKKRM